MKNMKSEFTFNEIYPDELTQKYQILECLNSTDGQETLFGAIKTDNQISDKKVVIKRFDKTNPLAQADKLPDFGNPADNGKPSVGIPVVIEELNLGDARYIVRDYIEGENLMEYSKTHTFSKQDIIDIGIQLCDILVYLHTRPKPIVHRDIKPENIIIQNNGNVVLIDFGIAREYKDKQGSDTIVVGTRQYAAPEQFGYRQTDSRSDIYSLGMVLTWLLKGNADIIENPQDRLEKVIQKCTAFAPQQRYQSAAELKKDLNNLMPDNIARHNKRKNISIALAGVVIVLAIAFFKKMHFDNVKKSVVFKEPLIEQAARLQLGKPEGILTLEDLEQVTQIYIISDTVYSSCDDFYQAYTDWFAGDMIRGSLSFLEDLENMPNLKDLYIGAEHIKDTTPLKRLDSIQRIELFNNDVEDLSSLMGKKYLTDVKLGHNPIKSIDFLSGCPNVTCLIIGGASGNFSGSVLADFDYFHTLDICCDSDCYKYLAGKTIQILKLGSQDLYDLECIRDAAHIGELYIYGQHIQDISALAGREDITYVYMGLFAVDDISPLFEMPNLEKAVVNPSQKAQIDALLQERTEPVGFEIEYTQ